MCFMFFGNFNRFCQVIPRTGIFGIFGIFGEFSSDSHRILFLGQFLSVFAARNSGMMIFQGWIQNFDKKNKSWPGNKILWHFDENSRKNSDYSKWPKGAYGFRQANDWEFITMNSNLFFFYKIMTCNLVKQFHWKIPFTFS